MKQRIILPISKPIIDAYPEEASLLSIIQDSQQAWRWFLSCSYIQLYVRKMPKRPNEFKLRLL